MECVSLLLALPQGEAAVHAKDRRGQTPLHLAALNGHAPAVGALSHCGADRLCFDFAWQSPLALAVQQDHVDCASVLLGSSPSPLPAEAARQLLLLAVKEGSRHMLNTLIAAGVRHAQHGGRRDQPDSGRPGDSVPATVDAGMGLPAAAAANSRPLQALQCPSTDDQLHWLIRQDPQVTCHALQLESWPAEELQLFVRDVAAHGPVDLLVALHRIDPELVLGRPGTFSPLHAAARHGELACLRFLLHNGADVHGGDRNDDTALHWAAFCGQLHCVVQLLTFGASTTATNRDGGTALHSAANHGAAGIGQVLLAAGANPNATMHDGNAPAHNCAYEGHADFLALLLEHGADPNTTNEEGRTPLHEAATNGHSAAVRVLCRGGGTAHMAVVAQQLRLQAIVSCALSSKLPSEHCRSPGTHLQALDGCTAYSLPLLDVLRAVQSLSRPWVPLDTGKSVVFPAERRGRVNARDHGGDTPLHWAVCNGHVACSRALLLHGASVGAMNIDGGQPLHAAIINNRPGCLRALLDFGADANARFLTEATAPEHRRQTADDTALIVAVADGREECLKALLVAGAHVDLPGARGRTALHEACRAGHVSCAEALLGAGAPLGCKDDAGRLPLQCLLPDCRDLHAASLSGQQMHDAIQRLAKQGGPQLDHEWSGVARFWLSDELADVRLACSDGEVVPSHMVVLSARCPLLARLLRHTLRDERKGREPPQVSVGIAGAVAKALLHFLYRDSLADGSPVSMLLQLFEVGEQFRLPQLQAACCRHLARPATLRELLAMYSVSMTFQHCQLRTVAVLGLCHDQAAHDMQALLHAREGVLRQTTVLAQRKQRRRAARRVARVNNVAGQLQSAVAGAVPFLSPAASTDTTPAPSPAKSSRSACGTPSPTASCDVDPQAGGTARAALRWAKDALDAVKTHRCFPLQPVAAMLQDLLSADWEDFARRVQEAMQHPSAAFVSLPFPKPPMRSPVVTPRVAEGHASEGQVAHSGLGCSPSLSQATAQVGERAAEARPLATRQHIILGRHVVQTSPILLPDPDEA